MKESVQEDSSDLSSAVKSRPFFKMLDEEYLKPFFIYNYRYRKEEIKEFKKLLKLNSPEYKGGEFVALMKTNARQTIIEEQEEEEVKKKRSIFTSNNM